MEPSSIEHSQAQHITQRELLGLILGCAASESASFSQALHAIATATRRDDARALTRELLSDLSIRGWIELRNPGPAASETVVPRIHYELELADERNWDQSSAVRTRYVLTEKGRVQVTPMLAELRRRGRATPA